jgi:hypothetical protein
MQYHIFDMLVVFGRAASGDLQLPFIDMAITLAKVGKLRPVA